MFVFLKSQRQLRVLAVLVLVASASCGYEPVQPPPNLRTDLDPPPPPGPPPADPSFLEDVYRLAETSTVYSRLGPAGKEALVRLSCAKAITTRGIGAGGTLSPHAEAFRFLLREPAARDAFAELSELPNPHAQVYGLAGLGLTDQRSFSRRFRALAGSPAELVTLRGCIVGAAIVREVLQYSSKGDPIVWFEEWVNDLAGTPRPDA